MSKELNVGIVADWLVTYAGAERVIKEFVDLYPSSEIYSVVDFLTDESRAYLHNKRLKPHLFKSFPYQTGNIKNIYH